MRYKGKGEHSVNQLETIIDKREEELRLLKRKSKELYEYILESILLNTEDVSRKNEQIKELNLIFNKHEK